MRIGIDGRVLDRKITGTGRYLINLLNELPNQDKKNEYFLFTNSSLPFDKEFYYIIRYKETKIPMKLYSPVWINIALPKLVKKYNIDLLFLPNVFAPFVKKGKVKYVSAIHDAIYKIYNDYHPLSYRLYKSLFLPKSIKNSDIVITVSEQSKKDIIKYDKVPEEKVRIVHNTASGHFKPAVKNESELRELTDVLKISGKYILYVGAVEKRKNVLGIIKIVDLVRERGSNLNLVILGKPGYGSELILPEIEKRKNFIKYIRYIDDKYLTKIYNYSFAFLFPSFYEGFGIPPLEAMQCGIPVLASNTSALLEVVGEGGILHPPNDYDNFANDILRLEDDSGFYDQMSKRALIQAEKFDIKKITKKLVTIFDELEI